MLIFLDTEFTDFTDCELISIGMVSQDNQHRFYAERSDYRRDWESEFVKSTVLPYLGKAPEAVCTRDELQVRLWAWFATLPSYVQVACDSRRDKDLLWNAFGKGLPPNLSLRRYELAHMLHSKSFHTAVCDFHAKQGGWHHALYDAQANRAGWLAWKEANTRRDT